MIAVTRRKLWQRFPTFNKLASWIFGYDFFISYAHIDGGKYAESLAEELEQFGYEVFLDTVDFAAGHDWKRIGAWTLQRTSKLILVGTEGALQSSPVQREVRIFSSTGRSIIPVDVDGSLASRAADSPIFRYISDAVIRVEAGDAVQHDLPSKHSIDRIRHSFDVIRQEEKRARIFAGIASVMLCLAIATTVFAFRSINSAEQARRSAEEARKRAATSMSDTGLELIRNGEDLRGVAYISSAIGLDPANEVAVDRLFTLMTQRGTPWRLLNESEDETLEAREDSIFEFYPDEGSGSSCFEDEEDCDYEDCDDPVKEMTLTSPDGDWRVILSYDRGEEQATLPYYYEVNDYRLPDYDDILDTAFDPASQYLAVTSDSGTVYVFSRQGGSGFPRSIEHHGALWSGFAERGTVLFTVAGNDIRFWKLNGSADLPATMRVDQYVKNFDLVLDGSNWKARIADRDSVSLWSYPISQFLSWTSKKINQDDPRRWFSREWSDRSKSALQGSRLTEKYMSPGTWEVNHPKRDVSGWPLLAHALSHDDEAEIYLQDNGSHDATTAHIFMDAAISGNGDTVITIAGRSPPRIWRQGYSDARAVIPTSGEDYIEAVKLDHTGQIAFILYSSGNTEPDERFEIYSTEDGRLMGGGIISGGTESLLDVSTDCRRLLILKNGSTLEVRDATNGQVIGMPFSAGERPKAAFNHNASRVATVNDTAQVQIWHTRTGLPLSEAMQPDLGSGGSLSSPWFSEDGQTLSLIKNGDNPKIYDFRIGMQLEAKESKLFAALSQQFYGVRLSTDNTLVLHQRRPVPQMLSDLADRKSSSVLRFAREIFPEVTPVGP